MLTTHRTRKTREYTGPTPHSVAIRAKVPTGKLPEHLLLERRRKEDMRNEAIRITKYNHLFDLKNDWEKATDRVIQKNTILRRVREVIEQDKLDLDDRRQRLRDLLASEEEAYLQEMEAKHETIEERQNKMLERAKELKEKREKERLQVVQEKLDQQWRDQCEELRGILTRRHQDEVCVDRMEQLALKAEMERRRQEEENMYADLWERDRLTKAAREEMEAQQQIERNRAMVEVLRIQKASLAAKRDEEKRLIDEEAKLMKEERELRQMEEDRKLQDKRDLQKKHKNNLEKSIKKKMQREAHERQEELALDMKILEQLLEESRNEAEEMLQRKLQRKDEEQKYRQYLHEQYMEEKRREKELDRLVEADVAAMWAKRVQQWRLEKEARNKLMQDVMETRKLQLQEKLQVVAREREELRRDREEMARAIEEHQRIEEERLGRTRETNKKHEADLLGQIEHIKSMKAAEDTEERRQYEEGLKTEQEYQKKLKQVLSTAVSHQKTHPKRMQRKQPDFQVVGSQLK